MFLKISCVISLIIFKVNCWDVIEVSGEKCTLYVAPGWCVHIVPCHLATANSTHQMEPLKCAIRSSGPEACCTKCKGLPNLTYIVQNPMGVFFVEKTGQKAWNMCINYLLDLPYPCKICKFSLKLSWNSEAMFRNIATPGITGGEPARRLEYPHMALLGYGDDMETAEWKCGGSLISDRFILTAAHCKHSKLGPVKYVALGILKRTDPPSTWKTYGVKRIIRHPDYIPTSKYHDIALLETDTIIQFEKTVLPACLHLGDEDQNINYNNYRTYDKARATGWGALQFAGELADNLQTVTLKKYTEEKCKEAYPPHRKLKHGYNHSTQMCFGDDVITDSKDACEGDSGGPLQIDTYKELRCIQTIIGVTSFGRACGVSGQPGIYTRVSHYLSWIESIVWP